jgi:hypothetical protein
MGMQTLFGAVEHFNRAAFVRKLQSPRFLAPILHIIVFATMYIAGWTPDGFDIRGAVAGGAFLALFFFDFPISIYGVGLMWDEGQTNTSFTIGMIIWAVVGTLWWFLLGLSIEAWVRRLSRKSAPGDLTPITAEGQRPMTND